MFINASTAIQALLPNASGYATVGDKITQWDDPDHEQPTDLEIQSEIAKQNYLAEVRQYQKDREYPSISDQLDQIYHEGVEAWKTTINAVKAAHPKVEPVEADQQAAIDSHVAQYVFNQQLSAYTTATARLAQYILADGRVEVTEMQPTGEQVWNEETMEMDAVLAEVITVSAIEPLEATVTRWVYSYDMEAAPTEETIENPLITADNAERVAAQAVIDATPDAVVAEA
jgi:hypothetical protein